MMRISDFALVKKSLEVYCYMTNQDFVDSEVIFGDEGPLTVNGAIMLQEDDSLKRTMFSIVYLYVKYISFNAPEETKTGFTQYMLNIIRDFGYSKDNGIDASEPIPGRLDQYPFVWFVLQNFFYPLQDIMPFNIKTISGKSAMVDMCKLVDENDMPKSSLDDDEFPFLFINLDISCSGILNACVLYESVKFLSDKNPSDAIKSVYSDYYVKNLIDSFVELTFQDTRCRRNFWAILSILCQSEEMETKALGLSKDMMKTAQNLSDMTGNWWFMGLTEKMLEPARSEDWSIYERWKPYIIDFHKKIEKERKLKGLDELPYESLLRVSVEDFQHNDTKILQSLLKDQRIWQ